MTDLRVSVIIVSRDRPKALLRCLTGISQLIYEKFEVIVIADATGIAAIHGSPYSERIKSCLFDLPNISAARNKGLSLAAGEIVVFIDDDAIPEPGWLFHLIAPFEDSEVAASGGFVRGRNGISYQWKASYVDSLGYENDLEIADQKARVFQGSDDRAIKTQGTNCAFRTNLLTEMGGFDTAFQFYLDETDLNMRFALAGCKTAIVPLAQVHHGYSGSSRRFKNRMPISLFDIGASTAVFLRKYAAERFRDARLASLMREQKKALIDHMTRGNCEPGEVERVMLTLQAGIKAGGERPIEQLNKINPASAPFLPFCRFKSTLKHKSIKGFRVNSTRLHQKAQESAKAGNITSLYVFSRTALFHRANFHDDGYWVQTGGLFGKSERSESLMNWYSMDERVEKEMSRVAQARFPECRSIN